MFNVISKNKLKETSAVEIAYIGDAVYELYIRSLILEKYKGNMDELHKWSVAFVKAEAQSALLSFLEPGLTEEELKIVKWGRNSKAGLVPSHASVMDYRYSTAFECLIGYLYVSKQYERLYELLGYSQKLVEEKEGNKT